MFPVHLASVPVPTCVPLQELIPTAGINVGGCINGFMRMQMLPFRGEDAQGTRHLRLCNLYGTLDGAIGYICPLDERNYKRLFMLQMRLVHALSHHAGLHPQAFRAGKTLKANPNHNVHNIIDGELVGQYSSLSASLQEVSLISPLHSLSAHSQI